MTTAYLSGPMRGILNANKEAFDAAREDLESQGYKVYCPSSHEWKVRNDPKRNTIEKFFRWDIKAVTKSDAIVVLPNWYASEGTKLEIEVAKICGLEILSYPTLEPLDLEEEHITLTANRIVHGPRQAVYDHPIHDFGRTAKMWTQLFGTEVTEEQVALAMILLKISRLISSPDHHDSVVDVAGYAETYGLVQQWRRDNES